ncbi:hypothetical protein URH17368_0548 [Alicyclobacillus hesperidum URH17-3-68]|nr:hypothetical protein URH17368_0548 [Alicyclobacillus hesperidum URH17-3-68]
MAKSTTKTTDQTKVNPDSAEIDTDRLSGISFRHTHFTLLHQRTSASW